MRKSHSIIIGALFCFAVVFSLIPWEWGLMDDVQFYSDITSAISKLGWVKGFISNFIFLWDGDRIWGLFRPSWWIYASSFYMLYPRVAYTIRLLMLYEIIGLPLIVLAKSTNIKLGQRKWMFLILAAALLASNRPLYDGVQFISLQEFSACFLVAIGLGITLLCPSNLFTDCLSGSLYLFAAWFKAPFIWLLFFYSLYIALKKKRYWTGSVYFLLALATFVTEALWAFYGTYTSRVKVAFFRSAKFTIIESVKAEKYFILILVLLIFFYWKDLKRTQLWKLKSWNDRSWYGFIFILAGILYYLNLLPWGATSYYFMAPFYLFGIGLIFFFVHHDSFVAEIKSLNGGMIFLITLVTIVALSKGLTEVYLGNKAVRDARDWAMTLPSDGVLLGTSRFEAAGKLDQLMKLRTNGIWKNQIIYVLKETPLPSKMGYYICFVSDNCHVIDGSSSQTLLESARLKIYKIYDF